MAFGLFKKKKSKEDNRFKDVVIKDVVHIAKDAVNLVFGKPEVFDYQPGQFITIVHEVNGKKIRRAYSLCTTPFEDEYPAVTVKRVPGGQMSNFLNEHVKVGDQIEIMEPMGMFTTSFDPSNNRKAVFFGGGSGITPLISIIRSVLLKEPKSETVLVYGNRSKEYIMFKDLIRELKGKYNDRFKVIHILEEGDADYQGRPHKDMIVQICKSVSCDQQTEFYICGPQPMMDIVAIGLKMCDFADEKIRVESFEVGKTSPAEIIETDSSESEVTILLNDDEFSITVPRSSSILDVALDDELDMPYSCQSGLCTACRGKCLEGKVSIDEAEGLSQEELEEGYVLTCVGKPLTDRVKIEIG